MDSNPSIERDKMFDEDNALSMAMRPCLACDKLDWSISVIWPLMFIAGYAIADTYLFHWFIIPIYFCGVLISVDAVHWFRSKMDTFDPRGLVGLFGCNFFVLSPILAAYYRADTVGEICLDDMRPWLGGMAFLNLFGIILYLFIERKTSQRPIVVKKCWLDNPGRSMVILPLSVMIIVLCHVYFIIKGGGISAYIIYKTYGEIGQMGATVGLGPINVIGRALPIVLLIAITVWFRKSGRQVSFVLIAMTLLVFLVGQFMVAGFTGSRASIMWALFWAAGIIHFFWRPIPVKLVIISFVPLMLFLYLYGFYKALGAKSFGIFTGEVSIKSLEYETRMTFARVLIGDMGRSNVQAILLSVVTDPRREYDFWYGKTYLTSVVSMIPRRIWPSKPEDNGKVVAGTEIFYGRGSYVSRWSEGVGIGRRATNIYGLAGEAMLNFGVWGILPAFAVWGCVVGWFRRRILNYSAGDMRLLIMPFLILLSFFLLIQDLDNLVETSVYNLLVPAVIVWVISFKTYRQNDDEANEPS